MINSRSLHLKMKKNLLTDDTVNTNTYLCEILSYSVQEERMVLQLLEGDLKDISLDAIYTAEFDSSKGMVLCEGVIKERYECEEGYLLVLHIENGFYKKNEIDS